MAIERTTLERMVMVNWGRVETLDIDCDRLLTIVEGDNAIGKTTILIAMFATLMPDKTTFHGFRNQQGEKVGISELTGRLTDVGTAWTACLALNPVKGYLLYGIAATKEGPRQAKIECFSATEIDPSEDLLSLFLDNDGLVRTFKQAYEHFQTMGYKFTKHDTINSYLKTLTEYGVHAGDLAQEKRRTEYANVVLSCMYGGISKDISLKLRDYLLPEKNVASSRLAEFSGALKECQKTKNALLELESQHEKVSRFLLLSDEMLAYAFGGMRRFYQLQGLKSDTSFIRTKRDLKDAVLNLEESREKHQAVLVAIYQVQADIEGQKLIVKQCEEAHRLTIEAHALLKDKERKATDESAAYTLFSEADDAEMAIKEKLNAAKAVEDEKIAVKERFNEAIVSAKAGLNEMLARAENYRKSQEIVSFLAVQGMTVPATVEEIDPLVAQKGVEITAARERIWYLQTQIDHAANIAKAHEVAGNIFKVALRRTRRKPAMLMAMVDRALAQRSSSLRTTEQQDKEVRQLVANLEKRNGVVRALAEVGAEVTAHDEFQEWEYQLREGITTQRELSRQAASHVDVCQEKERNLRKEIERLDGDREKLYTWTQEKARIEKIAGDLSTHDLLDTALHETQNKLDACKAIILDLTSEQEAARRTYASLSSGGISPDVVTLCEGIPGARLVANLFEDVSIEDSSRVEAALGDLAGGIIVDEPLAVAVELASQTLSKTVWLSTEENALAQSSLSATVSGAVIAATENAVRVTPAPSAPVIGRLARERERHKVKARLEALEIEIADSYLQRNGLGSLVEGLYRLRANPLAYDSTVEVVYQETLATMQQIKKEAAVWLEKKEFCDRNAAQMNEKLTKIKPFIVSMHLLDNTSIEDDLKMATVRVAAAKRHGAWHGIVASEASVRLTENIRQFLIYNPMTRVELEVKKAEKAKEEKVYNNLLNYKEQLSALKSVHHALEDHEAEAQASDANSRMQHLEEALTKAKREHDEANKAYGALIDPHLSAVSIKNEAAKNHAVNKSKLDEILEKIRDHQIGTATSEDVESAKYQVEQEQEKEITLGKTLSSHHEKAGEMKILVENLQADYEKKEQTAEKSEREFRSFRERYYRPLRSVALSCNKRDVWRSACHATYEGSDNYRILMTEAAKKALTISDHLEKTKDTEKAVPTSSLVDALMILQNQEVATSHGVLWVKTYSNMLLWLSTFYPEGVIGASDPAEALQKMESLIPTIKKRLRDNEMQFLDASKNITHSIRQAISGERRRLKRMSERIELMKFGSIVGIKLDVKETKSLHEFLNVLETEENLFTAVSDLSIEEVMEATYQKVARNTMTYSQLVDYRNYLEVSIKVKQSTAKEWKEVCGSTGESIAVGTAVFVTIFESWEDEMAQRRKGWAPMRLLLIDEASRLSAGTLQVVMNLAADLDVNIIAACPEAPIISKATSYHLEMEVLPNNKEILVVSGRRKALAVAE
jgi:chromosome condensin MukBEF ATPase and DNA-binding subunit MukB